MENGYARLIEMFCESHACVRVWTHWRCIQKSPLEFANTNAQKRLTEFIAFWE